MTGEPHARQWPSNPSFVSHTLRVIAVGAAVCLSWSPAAAQGAACTPVPVMSTRSLPEWPPGSRQANAQGTVTLEITVARNGRASRVRVTKSSGFPGLDEASVSHVQQKYLWQPMACASAKTSVKVVWDPAGLCALTRSCEPSRN